jgi:ABC-type lipoprotein release transport system permease subunit
MRRLQSVRYGESVCIALRALRANTLRSVLTMLGIIIGVAAVITMIAVGEGAHARVAQQIRSLGANPLMVLPGTAQEGRTQLELGSRDAVRPKTVETRPIRESSGGDQGVPRGDRGRVDAADPGIS